jgi:hypothetical protein
MLGCVETGVGKVDLSSLFTHRMKPSQTLEALTLTSAA